MNTPKKPINFLLSFLLPSKQLNMKKSGLLLLFSGLLVYGFAGKTTVLANKFFNTNKVSKATEEPIVQTAATPRRAEILFLGSANGEHNSNKYAAWLAIPLFKDGINITYTTDTNDLNAVQLNKYDGLIIYAKYDLLSSAKEKVLKDFVESGKGLIALHDASASFTNSAWYTQAIGGKSQTNKTISVFTASTLNPTHPVMQGVSAFSTTDESFTHVNRNPNMTVLQERVEGSVREPLTWVKNQAKGRVFYTAYGHNDSTWTKVGFYKLVRNGVLWAVGDQVKDQIAKLNLPNIDIYDAEFADYSARHVVPKAQEALTPEQSMKTMQVPVDFEIKLFAAEPDITNPIAMSWDERGRLWVVESVDYPNTFLETDGAANDRIKICEDTNGDGKADKFTVFADKLNIPTSIVFANGGLVVAMAPYFVFLKDTNGDDKADVRENIMTGWQKNDTHFGPNNLLYGFDNKIWGVVGSGFIGTTKDGESKNFTRGIYHLNPDGTDVEFLASTTNNTWGLAITEDNHVFSSTANNLHSSYYSMSGNLTLRPLVAKLVPATSPSGQGGGNFGGRSGQAAQLLSVQNIQGHTDVHTMTPNLRQVDVVGGFTAAEGHQFYTARNFPKEYWNRIAFVNEPSVRLIHNAIIEPIGAGFTEKDGWNFLASNDEWVGPVQTKVGPDGAVWVADWYNFIIQHNVFVPRQSPSTFVLPFTDQPRGQGNAFSSPMRDMERGRIYRIVYKDAKPYTPVQLSRTNTASLLSALENDNMFWRMTAQRLLVETKNMTSLPGLFTIINNQKVDEIGLNSPAVHALWTLKGLGVLEGNNAEALAIATKALSHPAAGVRKAALDVLPKNANTLDIIQKTGMLNDKNLNTRLTAILVISELPESVEAGKILYTASLNAENGQDDWLSRAIFAGVGRHTAGFLASVPTNLAEATPGSEMTLVQRIVKSLSLESYPLTVRNTARMAFSPDVTNKEITLKGSISKAPAAQGGGQAAQNAATPPSQTLEGVIVAQGNKNNGYVLYIQNGKVNMLVKQNGVGYLASTSEKLPEEGFDLTARLSKDGSIVVEINGKQAAAAKALSTFKSPLDESFRMAADVIETDKVGDYPDKFIFNNVWTMQNGSLELRK